MNISAYKKKDGLTYYMFHAYLGIDEKTGKPKKVCRRGFKSKKDAQLAYIRLVENNPLNDKEIKKTFRDIYDLWVEEYKTQVKESSFITINNLFKYHILPELGHYYIKSITHADLQKAVSEWAKSIKKVSKAKMAAGQVFRYAVRHDYIDKDPTALVKVPRAQVEETEFENYLDFDELRLFLETADKILDKKWSTFLYLLAFTGLRRGEALALEWKDIDFNNKTLRVDKAISKAIEGYTVGSTKTTSGTRTISLGDILIEKLKGYKEDAMGPLVFPNSEGRHTTFSQPLRKITRVCKAAGLKHISTHGLRHTHCCLLFESGATIAYVQHRLGHKSSAITLDIYNHVTKGKEKEGTELFDRAFLENRGKGNQNGNQRNEYSAETIDKS